VSAQAGLPCGLNVPADDGFSGVARSPSSSGTYISRAVRGAWIRFVLTETTTWII
jgi:hypothetical protein